MSKKRIQHHAAKHRDAASSRETARHSDARAELLRSASAETTQPTPPPAELEVASLVAEGKMNKEIAAALWISEKTVEAHLSRIFRKLGIRNRAELAGRQASGISPTP